MPPTIKAACVVCGTRVDMAIGAHGVCQKCTERAVCAWARATTTTDPSYVATRAKFRPAQFKAWREAGR